MNELSLNLVEILAAIRSQAIIMGIKGWPDLGNWMRSSLPDPLTPMALLPVATGVATAGKMDEIVDAAAIIILIDLALRIVDDCADQDNPHALYLSLGMGRAANYALALNTIATRELAHAPLAEDRLAALLNHYFRSFLQICQGQDQDMKQQAQTLDEYQEMVKLKGVAAYELAAVVGGIFAGADTEAITLCARCGVHLAWMTQILDDIEALWFPLIENIREVEKMTFPVLLGLTMKHPNAQRLQEMFSTTTYDRTKICQLLDEMNVRPRLMHVALDHRDKAIETLGSAFNPEGSLILKLCLDWLLRDSGRLLGTVNYLY